MSIELKQAAEKALVVLGSATSFMSRKARDQHESVVAELSAAIQQAEAQQPTEQDEQEANGLPPIVAGAIFDFAGFMTTRSEVIEVGSTAEAGPVADLVKEWAESRDLDLADAAVLSWQLHITRASLPATPEPVGFTYQAEIDYANSTGGNGSFWRVPPDLDDEAVPLYAHPAPSVPGDVMRDAERYRWLRDHDHWPAPFSSSQEPEPVRGRDLDSNIDAAMIAAKDSK